MTSLATKPDASAEIKRASIPLTQLTRGCRGRISEANLDADDRAVLRAMGLKPSASIEVCRAGQPCIVALSGICGGGCRIGLSKDLASRVMVDPDD